MKTRRVVQWFAGGIVLASGWAARPAEAQARAGAAPAGFECVAGDVAGIKAADGQTAVGIVCRELSLAAGQVGRYRVSLRPLGYSVVLEVERLDVPARQTATLAGVEETATAAPRIAQALARNEPLRRTQRVDTLLWNETRQGPLKEGRLSLGFGVLGLQVPGQDVRAGGGFAAALTYNTANFAVPVQFRVAGSGDRGRGTNLVGFDVGMRWLPSKSNFSPFAGGGMGWLHWSVDDETPSGHWDEASCGGVAPYVEVGVEMLRLHRTRLLLSVRADLPLQSLERPEGCDWDERSRRCVTYPEHSFYAVPITVGLSVAF